MNVKLNDTFDESGDPNSLDSSTTHEKLFSERMEVMEKVDPKNLKRDGLTPVHVAAYSVGHFINDLTVAQWFIYCPWYLKNIVGLEKSTVGRCLLLGQISDAFSTQIIGLYSDKISTRFGKRMPFYYFGFLLVVPSAICLFVYP